MGNVTESITEKFADGVFAFDPMERVVIDAKLQKHIDENDPHFDEFFAGADAREIAEVEQTSAASKVKIVEGYAMALAYDTGEEFSRRLMTKLVGREGKTRTQIVDEVHAEENGIYRFHQERAPKRSCSFYTACLGLNLF